MVEHRVIAVRIEGETPEEELVRLLVATDEMRREGTARIEELLAVARFEELLQLATMQRLLPLVGSRLRSSDPTGLPEWFEQAVDKALSFERRRSLLLEELTAAAVRELESAGVPVLVLKGPRLGEEIYGDPGLRSSGDVDLLVSPDALETARELLLAAGYSSGHDPLFDDRPLLHYRLFSAGPIQIRVELHWRIHWYESAFSEELVQSGGRGAVAPAVLDPASGLAALLLFWVRDGLVGLRYAADIAAWWDRFGSEIEPGALAAIGATHPRLERALAVSGAVAARVVGLPHPALARQPAQLDRRERLACRLANWTCRGDSDQIGSNRVLVDLLVSPSRGHAAFARRQLAPPPETLRELYPSRSRAAIPLLRAMHPVKLAARFAYAGATVRGSRTFATEAPRST